MQRIKARQVHAYQVNLPEALGSVCPELEVLMKLCLFNPVHPTRTQGRYNGYFLIWLDWLSSKDGESPMTVIAEV